ncbi:MAG: hypothetical protein JWR01_1483, partial [Subtercola sp.]|nr:hypothetical protein [Subtercola sp.]
YDRNHRPRPGEVSDDPLGNLDHPPTVGALTQQALVLTACTPR